MTDYQAPLQDMAFLLNQVLKAPEFWQRCDALRENIDSETADAILSEVAKLTQQLIAPLNRLGDEQGCQWLAGKVKTPDGYKQAFQQFAEDGWIGLAGDPQYGGLGMPKVLAAQVEEMTNSASLAFGLYPMLTSGAALALLAHASDELKATYLPKLYSGEWAGSMCLTESHAGTDLGLLRTQATPQTDGSYHITGSKIFITGGEHDLTENIIHLVLARLPDAPAGSRGISLFLVPKVLLSESGELGRQNAVSCGSIEQKMGIHGSSTCVLNFDAAQGWLVGEAHRGLAAMFTMMNYERLAVGIQGLAVGERSYQAALSYAKERLQSRATRAQDRSNQPADPILMQPDVRRMLLTMKALTEGGRAFSSYVALALDKARYSQIEDERQQAEQRVALLTPIAKAFLTDLGFEVTVLGQQVFGGHGYIREAGQEQLVRDCRITQIYEGTNGIQALDLLGRKVIGSEGALYDDFAEEISSFLGGPIAQHPEFAEPLQQVLTDINQLTVWLIEQAATDESAIGSASVEYLHALGYLAYAYLWAQMALKASDGSAPSSQFAEQKLTTAQFYFARILPRYLSLISSIKAGSQTLYSKIDVFS